MNGQFDPPALAPQLPPPSVIRPVQPRMFLPALLPALMPWLMPTLVPVLFFVSACSRPQTEFPIARDELPAVLIDVYVAEAEARLLGADLADARVEALKRHGYDTVDFGETMRLLTEDPDAAKAIYQTVLDSVIFEQRDIRAKGLDKE